MNIYVIAARILDKVDKQQGTIKSLVLSEKNADIRKRLYALICESLKYRKVIEEVMDKTGILKAEKHNKLTKSLGLVLVYDLVVGKGIKMAGQFKDIVLRHQTRLRAEFVKIKVKRKCAENQMLIPEHIRNAIVLPRYLRVNTLKTATKDVLLHFASKGFSVKPGFPSRTSPVVQNTIIQDPHLPELLLLPSNTDLHQDRMLLDGKFVLQDKASCLPAFLLRPPKGSTVIDACAAPGNKTSHLAAIMQNSGTIYAFDKDKTRLDTLIRLTGRAGCSNINAIHQSFLDADPLDPKYSQVEYMLLDPSCSGSGIVGRMDHLLADHSEENSSCERLEALATFQKQVILHAFKFPKVRRIVYSTCSLHEQENESVVSHVLQNTDEFELVPNVFPQWKRRGLESFEHADKVIRTVPEEDMTIGFFVALFRRKEVKSERKKKY